MSVDNQTKQQVDELLPRTNCPPSCDGYGTYAEADEEGDPTPAQCQWCYEVVIPMREKLLALLAQAEVRGRVDGRRIQAEASYDKWIDANTETSYHTFLKAQVDAWRYESASLKEGKEG